MIKSDDNQAFDELLRGAANGAARGGSCQKFDAEEASAYLERQLSSGEAAGFESHLADCAICRGHVLELSRLAPVEVEQARPVTETAGWLSWLGGWRLGVIGGLATASLLIFVVSQKAPLTQVASERSGGDSGFNSATAPVVAEARPSARAQESPAASASSKEVTPASGVPAAVSEGRADKKIVELPPPPTPAPALRMEPSTAGAPANAVQDVLPKENAAEATRNLQARDATGPMQNQNQAARGQIALEVSSTRSEGIARVAKAAPSDSARDMKESPIERFVGGKTFRFEAGTWVDSDYPKAKDRVEERVKIGSDEYRKLLAQIPALKAFFDLGQVVVVWEGKVYRTVR